MHRIVFLFWDSTITRNGRRDGFRDEAGPERSERSHPAAEKAPSEV